MGSRRFTHEFLIRRGAASSYYIDSLFPEQRAYVTDAAKALASCCSRRSGKTYGNVYRLKRATERHPGKIALYVHQSKNHARQQLGAPFLELSKKWRWGFVQKEVDNNLMLIAPNGAQIWLAGAKHRVDFEKFRGFPFSEVIIDEAQLYPFLGEAIDDVLEATLGDLDGAVVVSGTPSPIPTGFFHAITTGEDHQPDGSPIPKWPTHHWTLAENPHYRGGQGAQYREDLRIRRGWAPDHPTLQREYFGRWIRDEGALVFPYDAEKNRYTILPDGKTWHYVLGVDLGSSQEERSTAFVLLAYSHDDPCIYTVKTWKAAGMTPSQIAVEIERLRREYSIGSIVIDAGGLGGAYVEEFNQRYGKYAQAAEKQSKMAFVEMLRGDLKSGIIKIDPFSNQDLLNELQVLQWNEARDGFDERFDEHAVHAWLYGWREARTYYRPTDQSGPIPGTAEWVNAEAARHKAEIERRILEQQRKRFKKRGFG